MANVVEILGKLASNPKLIDKIKATKTPEEIVALAKENDVELTLEEVKKALSQESKYTKLFSHIRIGK